MGEATETNEGRDARARVPVPSAPVITIRQPWASLIALGFKHYEFRSKRLAASGQRMTIHAGSKWHSQEMRAIARAHFCTLMSDREQQEGAMRLFFPLSAPVAQVTIASCAPARELSSEDRKFGGSNADDFAIKLADVRIVAELKPVLLRGVVNVPWYEGWLEREHSEQTLMELANALGRARKFEGAEKREVYRLFRLPALADRISAAIQ